MGVKEKSYEGGEKMFLDFLGWLVFLILYCSTGYLIGHLTWKVNTGLKENITRPIMLDIWISDYGNPTVYEGVPSKWLALVFWPLTTIQHWTIFYQKFWWLDAYDERPIDRFKSKKIYCALMSFIWPFRLFFWNLPVIGLAGVVFGLKESLIFIARSFSWPVRALLKINNS